MANPQLMIDVLLNDRKAMAKLRQSLGKIESTSRKSTRALVPNWLKVTAVIAGATLAAKAFIDISRKVGGSVIAAGASFERLRTEIRAFSSSTEEANEIFQNFVEFSARTPFQVEEVAAAGKQLLILRDKGVDVSVALEAVGNIAAATGLSVQQAAENMVRVFNQGAASADLFRERGITALAESKTGMDLLKVSSVEAGNAMVQAFTSGDLGQATIRLSKTFAGLSSTIKDNFQLIKNDIAEAGFFDSVKNDAAALLTAMTDLRGSGKEYSDVIEGISNKFVEMKDFGIDAIEGIAIATGQAVDKFSVFNEKLSFANEKFQAISDFVVNGPFNAQSNLVGAIGKFMFGEEDPEGEVVAGNAETAITRIVEKINEAREEVAANGSVLDAMMGSPEDLEAAKQNTAGLFASFQQGFGKIETDQKKLFQNFAKDVGTATKQATKLFSGTISSIITGEKKASDAFKELGTRIIDIFTQMAVQFAIQKTLALVFQATVGAATAATAAALATAWAPAAALASLATFGANSGPASAGIAATSAVSQGVAALSSVAGLAEGGTVLSPGDFIVGERGPERLRLPTGSEVSPLDSGGGGTVINIELNNVSLNSEDDIRELAQQVSEFIAVENSRL